MTITSFLIPVLLSVLAAVFHNMVEIKGLKQQLEAAGKTFSFREHIRRNWFAWLTSLIPIIMLPLVHYHVYHLLPKSQYNVLWVLVTYAVVGWGGSDFAISIFSTSQKRLTQVIQNKSGVDISQQ